MRLASKSISFVLIAILIIVVIAAAFFASQKKPQQQLTSICGTYNKKQIEINNKSLEVFISDDDCKRQLGLGAVNSLNSNEGMLFTFPNSGNYGFWMKDMKFPIDMIWIDENMQIVGIEKNIATSTYPEVFGIKYVSKYVLEVSAGYAEDNNLKIRNQIKGF